MSKLAIITGADGGMGTEITRAVAQAGYHVIMLCYTLFKGEERKNQLILETGNKEIEVRQVDLSSMASVTNIADDLLGRGKHIDLLMNNAGTMSSGGLITTEDGLEYTVAVNYVAPFLLTTGSPKISPHCHNGLPTSIEVYQSGYVSYRGNRTSRLRLYLE